MAIDQITTGVIKDNAVTSAKIPAGAIEIADVADDAITSAKIAAGAVDATALGTGAVGTAKIAADAIDGTKLADNAVNSEHVTAGAIDTAHIGDDQVTGAKIENNPTIAGNLAVTGKTTLTGDFIPATAYNHRNVIYNGGMQIYQRGAGAPATNNGGFALDRWRYATWGSPGVVTVTQDSDVPSGQGFSSSLKMDVTTADASPAAGDSNGISMKFEGKDLQRFAKGVSGAKASTVSFWVKSPKTGVHIVWLYDNDNNRQISKSYTIASANTWENHSVTFAGDTTGAWGNDINESAQLTFLTMAGANASSGTLATSWESYTAANRGVGQVNCMDNTANNFYLTGVQWELGSNATPFEHRSYGDELIRCQRYFCKFGNGTNGACVNLHTGAASGADKVYINYWLPATPRTTPTVSAAGEIRISDNYVADHAASPPSIVDAPGVSSTFQGGRIRLGSFSGLTTGRMYGSAATSGTGSMSWSMEL